MHNRHTHILAASAAVLLTGSACTGPQFTVKGDIEGADKGSVVLEKSDFGGRWVAVDSTRTDGSGHFEMHRPAPASPEIFRLAYGGRYVYLPVDSTETITVTAAGADFDTSFTLSGSAQAEALERFDKDVAALPADCPADSLAAFKRRVYTEYLRDAQGSIVSYYVLTKTRGGAFLFDPEADYKYYAAVATAFDHYRPDDPHTALLKQTSVEGMRRRNTALGRRQVLQGEEITMIDITLPDEHGRQVSLSDIAGHGKRTVLVFSLMNEPQSPAINARLAELHKRGVEIYQVSVDTDQYAWRDAAANLPWTTVFDPSGTGTLAKYNVSVLPAYFIYSPSGDLTDRAADLDDLSLKLR